MPPEPVRVELRGAVAVVVFDDPERRNAMTLSITERELYLDLNGTSVSSAIHDHRIE